MMAPVSGSLPACVCVCIRGLVRGLVRARNAMPFSVCQLAIPARGYFAPQRLMCRPPVPAPFMSLPKQKPKYCNLISFLHAQFRDFYLCLLAPAVVPLHEAMAHATDAPLVGRHGISKVSGASHAGSVDGINSDSPGAPSQPNDHQDLEAGAPAELRRRGTVALDPDESFGFGVWHGAETVRDAHSEGTETHETRRRRNRSRGALRVPDAVSRGQCSAVASTG
ncbi:hypothetical protein FDECE_16835 [Fusarium decemcellulare]|nr:hypothetical protein FDECE_16835 [Fusarium decemcellulare]